MKRMGLAMTALALLALTGCSAEADEPEAVAEPQAEVVPLADQELSEESLSPAGHIRKEPGDLARLTDASGEALASFTVVSVEPDPVCTQASAAEPVNGHFVELVIEVETSAALADATLDFTAPSWSSIDAEGNVTEDALGSSDTCMGPASRLPADTAAGEKRRGTVVLDVADTTGELTLDLGGPAPWDWRY